jgi:DNA-binding transcriptional regulator GbsR (MarR family)
VPVRGDRRDHFEAEIDPWEIFARIAAGRKEREIDPAIAALRACQAAAATDSKIHPVAQARLHALLDLVDSLDRWYGQMRVVPRPQIAALVRLGARIVNLLSLGKRKK